MGWYWLAAIINWDVTWLHGSLMSPDTMTLSKTSKMKSSHCGWKHLWNSLSTSRQHVQVWQDHGFLLSPPSNSDPAPAPQSARHRELSCSLIGSPLVPSHQSLYFQGFLLVLGRWQLHPEVLIGWFQKAVMRSQTGQPDCQHLLLSAGRRRGLSGCFWK